MQAKLHNKATGAVGSWIEGQPRKMWREENAPRRSTGEPRRRERHTRREAGGSKSWRGARHAARREAHWWAHRRLADCKMVMIKPQVGRKIGDTHSGASFPYHGLQAYHDLDQRVAKDGIGKKVSTQK